LITNVRQLFFDGGLASCSSSVVVVLGSITDGMVAPDLVPSSLRGGTGLGPIEGGFQCPQTIIDSVGRVQVEFGVFQRVDGIPQLRMIRISLPDQSEGAPPPVLSNRAVQVIPRHGSDGGRRHERYRCQRRLVVVFVTRRRR